MFVGDPRSVGPLGVTRQMPEVSQGETLRDERSAALLAPYIATIVPTVHP